MVSPFGFSLAGLRCGAMLPSFCAFANQYSAVSFLFIFGPQAPCTPDFSRRSITESWAAASEAIAACGVFAPDDACPMFFHHKCAGSRESGTLLPVGVHCAGAGER